MCVCPLTTPPGPSRVQDANHGLRDSVLSFWEVTHIRPPRQPRPAAQVLGLTLACLLAACQVVAPVPAPPTQTAAPDSRAMGPCGVPAEPAAAAHYAFVVDLDYAHHAALVTQTVEINNNSRDAWGRVVLQVAPARYPGAFTLDSLSVAGAAAAYAVDRVSYTYAITLPRQLEPCDGTSLALTYRLDVPATSADSSFPEGNLGYGKRVIQFGNWYPVLVPYREGRGWHTWPWVEVGDPWVSEVADYDLEVRAPAPTVVAGSGPLGEDGGVWRFRLNRARGVAFSASPEYQMLRSVAEGVSVYSYYLSGHERAGADVLAAAGRSLTLFARLYGPYPYPSLTIAENAYESSMEYSAFVSHGGAKYAEYDGQPDARLIAHAAHEIAHQWWYGLVGSDQVYEPWLDEALASYAEVEFYRAYYPGLAAQSLARFGDPRDHGTLDGPLYDYRSGDAYRDEFYDVAGQFASVMHDGLGDDAYHEFLREWRARGAYRLATAQEFFALYGAYSPGQCTANVAAYFPGMAAQAGGAASTARRGAAILCGAQPAG